MRRRALWLAGVLLLAASTAAVADIGDYLGKTIVSVRIETEGREVTDPRIVTLVQTPAGSPLSMIAVRETVTHLFSLGQFEDVHVWAGAAGSGVGLVYELLPLHPIEKIVFEGAMSQPGIDQGRLRRAVVERYGASPPAARRLDLARIIQDDLREHAYLHATVSPRITTTHDPDRATLIFTIEPGVRTRIGAIEVAGTPGLPPAPLLDRLRLKPGDVYERDALNARIQQYQESRRADGYVEATLTAATRFEDGDQLVNLTLTAVLGPRVRVVFNGDPIPGDKHDELVPVVEETSADEDLLEDSSHRIEEYLRGLGYRDATAPHTREEGNGQLLITFTITRGPQYRIADVSLMGNTFLPAADLEARLRVRKGQPFASARLDADLAAIEDLYRRQGFAAVRVTPSVDIAAGPSSVAQVSVLVRVDIVEGVRTVVGAVTVGGNRSVPEGELRMDLGLQPGRPFFLTQMALDRDAIQLHYANLGFQTAAITGNPGISGDGRRADVVFTVTEGPQLIVDHLLIVGNVRTSTETIERELQIKPGDPLGLAAVTESQRRLAELGLFRRVRITQVPHGEETRRDLVVTVDEAPVTTIGYGGGIEAAQRIQTQAQSGAAVERLQVAPRAFFEIGRRNLFGKNRSVNLFTRVSLRPDSSHTTSDAGSTFWFSEYRVFGAFREPRVFGTPADAFLTGTIEQQVRSSFNFSRRAFSAEMGRRLTRDVSVSGNYQIQRTELFDEHINEDDKLLIDRVFPQLLLSSFSISGVQSTRDDAVNPTAGHYVSANGQLAARHIGSEVGLFKSYLTAQMFRTLPRTSGTVLAASMRLGMAYGFPRTVSQTGPVAQSVRDLPASERFFAGGDTTVRGFALDQLGTRDTLDKNGFALGGNALVILNAELRVPVHGSFGAVAFFDSGNIFARTTDIDLGQLRSAVGVGVRYRSPVGPIRVDVGFKTRRHEVVPGVREARAALHISLGQAF